jgi:hypothetical protein
MRMFFLTLFMLILPAGAYAACNPGDLTGTYQIYGIAGDDESEMITCIVKVQASGFLKKGTACVEIQEGGAVDKSIFVSRGKLTVTSQCKVKGFVVIGDGGGTEREDVMHATLSQDRSTLFGILKNVDGSLTEIIGLRK